MKPAQTPPLTHNSQIKIHPVIAVGTLTASRLAEIVWNGTISQGKVKVKVVVMLVYLVPIKSKVHH